jgi:sugar phosphate isomerase/epimerase
VGQAPEAFADVLASATELGAPVVRVWAGTVGSAQADEVTWASVVDDTRRIADMAQTGGLVVAYEYHPNTLTDTNEAAVRLLAAVDHPGVRSYWQMRDGASFDEHLASLGSVLPWLTHVHVQASQGGQRTPLFALEQAWVQILAAVASTGHDHTALIEFVRGDSPEQFLADAATLKRVSA